MKHWGEDCNFSPKYKKERSNCKRKDIAYYLEIYEFSSSHEEASYENVRYSFKVKLVCDSFEVLTKYLAGWRFNCAWMRTKYNKKGISILWCWEVKKLGKSFEIVFEENKENLSKR